MTACAEICPAEATTFGDRDAMLAEAHRRIRENPGSYVEQVYGENELGGTSVFFLASQPFEALGFPANLPGSSLPDYTWQALSRIPNVVAIGGTLLMVALLRGGLRNPTKDFKPRVAHLGKLLEARGVTSLQHLEQHFGTGGWPDRFDLATQLTLIALQVASDLSDGSAFGELAVVAKQGQ